MAVIDTPLMEKAYIRMTSVEIPRPPAQHRHGDVEYHEVLGPHGEPLLVAFGLVPLADWLEAVNDYHASAPAEAGLGEQPWDPEDPEKVVAVLSRLHYDRVSVTVHEASEEAVFTIQWGTQGLVPVTVWVLDFDAREEE